MRGDAGLDRRILSKRKLELDNGVRVVRGLVIDRLRDGAHRSDHLTREIPFAVVIIADGIHHGFRCDDVARKRNIRLRRANELALFVHVIILFFEDEVNTSDDIPCVIVGIFVSGDFDTVLVKPSLTHHLTRGIVGRFHSVAVGVFHFF